ncbi:hypothetical protein IJ732_02100 [bacterium]|nr:hypothetical protein [bacterium]
MKFLKIPNALKTFHSNSASNAEDTLPCHCEECVSTTSQSYDIEKRKDIGSRRSRWSLAMTCIEDKSERSGLYSNSASSAEDTLPCHCEPERSEWCGNPMTWKKRKIKTTKYEIVICLA